MLQLWLGGFSQINSGTYYLLIVTGPQSLFCVPGFMARKLGNVFSLIAFDMGWIRCKKKHDTGSFHSVEPGAGVREHDVSA